MSIVNMVAGNIALRVGQKVFVQLRSLLVHPVLIRLVRLSAISKHGYADVMIAGGSESTICEIGIAGFASLTALTTESDPDKASIPFDKTAAGLLWEKVLGF